MDAQTLAEVMGGSADYARFAAPFTEAMDAAGCTTVRRAAMFCAQIGHESAGLRYMEEIASGDAYEGRSDLGNIHPGDGRRFKGSGPIQLTGRNNFRAFTRWVQSRGLTTLDFEQHPELVRQDPRWGFLAATWYWTVARPEINDLCDAEDIEGVTRAINGGLNGFQDRKERYERALGIGQRLLGGGQAERKVMEKVLDYPRDQVTQDTFYNCGPASCQTVIRSATGGLVSESVLGKDLRTTTNGTDYIGQFPAVLNANVPGGEYRHRDVGAYPDYRLKDVIWDEITNSIRAGHGVVANIVAPPSNYPRAVAPSTMSPRYGGGVVYHYIAVMGYSDEGMRKLWIADSGFYPYGYWIGFDQFCTLIVPKGYAYSTAAQKTHERKEAPVGALTEKYLRISSLGF
ncbi:C39 family peptidase [Corynebacterium silvaticum]|nr:basic endochitinase [Corynebacterium silvaticum]TRM15422.1 basic endochitinase [Corynebacterium silvaticum]UWH01261.1 C39 family peptidase [Corynebacterium silvaticum]UWH01378.1 C39 family peptidase [Corynebacterium silvaticum]UWH03306.1 C39 family peptidase [Corynebacterium silvaticum]